MRAGLRGGRQVRSAMEPHSDAAHQRDIILHSDVGGLRTRLEWPHHLLVHVDKDEHLGYICARIHAGKMYNIDILFITTLDYFRNRPWRYFPPA